MFTDVSVDGDTARAVVDPAYAERLCEGHFPGDPLVPGAYLAELMAALAARLADGPLREVARCVFLRPVRPSERIEVEARRRDPSIVDVALRADGSTHAEATVRFG